MWKVSKIITGSSSSTTLVKKTFAHGESAVNVEPARHEVTGICVGSIPFRWRNQLLLLLLLLFQFSCFFSDECKPTFFRFVKARREETKKQW